MPKPSDNPPFERRRFSIFPKALSQTIAQVVKPLYKKNGFAEHRILTEWHLIVGEEMAAYCLPQKLVTPRTKKEGGTLHVLAAGGRALELQHMQPEIQSRITTYFGYPAVTRFAFTQAHPAFFRKETKKAIAPKMHKDTPYTALAAQSEDNELRIALQSLAQALAGVEK